MISNYLKIAWRNLLKHKTFSVINIMGLAIGIAACMVIYLYVHNELTFDQYNTKVDRIARVTTTLLAPESNLALATSAAPLASALIREFPEVEAAVRLNPAPKVVKFNDELFSEDNFYTTDQSIFSVFTFHFLEGTSTGALQNPNGIVITKKIAKKYFGKARALGKLLICNKKTVVVTGVVENRPPNSDINIDALLSEDFSKQTKWLEDMPMFTFVLFRTTPNLKDFDKKLAEVSTKYVAPELRSTGDGDYHVRFEAEPLANIHFSKEKLADTPKGNKQFNYVFSLLAVLILVIALLNYINLSTAKSSERAKEVGIRKVSGALPFQLMRQFLFESFLLITIAWILAIALVQVGLPFFNKLLQTTLAINWAQGMLFMGVVFLITLLLAGLYPAFVLAAFRPVKVLKGNWLHSGKGVWLRKTVTITQFTIAAALIMGTTVIYQQMNFVRHKDLGFNQDQLLNISMPRDSADQSNVIAFRQALRQRSEISDFTVGSGMIDDGLTIATTYAKSAGKKRDMMCNYYSIDPHFLPVFQIRLAAGRNLSDSFGTDKKQAFLVNEAFVKAMGWKTGVGQSIEGFEHKGKIVGVVKNFYYKSLHNLVEPLVMVYNINPVNTITARIKPRDLPVVKDLFKKYFPALPLEYSFFDEIVNNQYEKDKITMSLFINFTILAIFVSCLGLYGLVALVAVQRTKEIGIRKVLGASLRQLLSLLAKDFLQLVCWSLVIALPVAGFVMNKWLNAYAYHTPLSWWMFAIPAVVVLLIALAVISREILRTALTNPVKSLKTE
jgi:putative ABC transport system permease protein